MSENKLSVRKHRQKKFYLDELSLMDGSIVLVGLAGIVIILVIMVLILIQLWEMLW